MVGGSARWLVIGPLPAVHPAEIAKLALIVYLAHWLASRGKKIGGFRSGTVPFLLIAVPVIALVFKEPDLGTTVVITLTAFTMFFVAGASLWQLGGRWAASPSPASCSSVCRDYQIDRIRRSSTRGRTRSAPASTRSRACSRSGSAGSSGRASARASSPAGCTCPNAWNDFIFAIIGEEFGFVGAGLVIVLFVLLAYAGIRTALRAPDTFGALLAVGITAWLCFQAFINIAVVVALLPVTGITLPFISAGGSSLIISFAAAGILLSISRETVEREAAQRGGAPRPRGRGGSEDRRTDATADRGRRDRGTHLPGARRRDVAPSPTRRA